MDRHTDRHGNTDEFPALQCGPRVGHEFSKDDSYGHGENDPYDQEAIEEAEASERGYIILLVVQRRRRTRNFIEKSVSLILSEVLLSRPPLHSTFFSFFLDPIQL
jgi:hypothetical protein